MVPVAAYEAERAPHGNPAEVQTQPDSGNVLWKMPVKTPDLDSSQVFFCFLHGDSDEKWAETDRYCMELWDKILNAAARYDIIIVTSWVFDRD